MADSNTAERIAAITRTLLETEGPEAVSMRRIAAEVGITPMAIYHHFANREALLAEVTAREFDHLAASFGAQPARASFEQRMITIADIYLDYAFRQPRVFDYVFSQSRADARTYPTSFRNRESPTLNYVADQIQDAMKKKQIRKDDVWELAMEVWALLHGYMMLHRAGRIALSHEEVRQLCHRGIRRLCHGLEA